MAAASKCSQWLPGEKNVAVIFVFLCVFVCFFVCPALPQAPLASRARLDLRVYGVTHAGAILTERLEKEKPTMGKGALFSWNSTARPKSPAAPLSSPFALPLQSVGLYYRA
jgi:hypothetical protein